MKYLHRIAPLALIAAVAACTSDEDARGRKLSLIKVVDQTLQQGETNKVKITVTRSDWDGDVDVEFSNLPSGVSIVESDTKIAKDDNTRDFTLHAENDAAIVENHAATVTVIGPGDLRVTETFEITVKKGDSE